MYCSAPSASPLPPWRQSAKPSKFKLKKWNCKVGKFLGDNSQSCSARITVDICKRTVQQCTGIQLVSNPSLFT